MKFRISLESMLVFAVFSFPIFADIQMLTPPGISFTPARSTVIRMKAETVDLYFGEPTRVVCRFVMENLSGREVAASVGFPTGFNYYRSRAQGMEYYLNEMDAERDLKKMIENHVFNEEETKLLNKQIKHSDIYDTVWAKDLQEIYQFVVKVNGRKIDDVYARDVIDPLLEQLPYACTWFGWDCLFAPGETVIDVSYIIHPYYSYKRDLQNIRYVLSTGASWQGTIGGAVITVHFPGHLTDERIMVDTHPDGWKMEAGDLVWRLHDFEPTRDDDIQVEYMPQELHRKIEAKRRAIEGSPGKVGPRLDLAFFYFRSILTHSLSQYDFIDAGEFGRLLAMIGNGGDRKLLEAAYERAERLPGVIYYKLKEAPDSMSRSENETRVFRILCDSGFEPQWRDDLQAEETERLLQEAVALEPQNAKAWNIYLAFLHRMHFLGASSQAYSRAGFVSEKNRSLILQAFQNCPQDQGIKLWREMLDDSLKPVPEDNLAIEELADRSSLALFEKHIGPYNAGPISPADMDVLLKYYDKIFVSAKTISGKRGEPGFREERVFRLKPKKKSLAVEEKAEIVTLVQKVMPHFYIEWYGKKINRHLRKLKILDAEGKVSVH